MLWKNNSLDKGTGKNNYDLEIEMKEAYSKNNKRFVRVQVEKSRNVQIEVRNTF